jgi:hypothetical protein
MRRSFLIVTVVLGVCAWLAAPAARGGDDPKGKKADSVKEKSPDAAKDKAGEGPKDKQDKGKGFKRDFQGPRPGPWAPAPPNWSFHPGGPWPGFGPMPGMGPPGPWWRGPGMPGPAWGGWGWRGFGPGGPPARPPIKMPNPDELFKKFDVDGNGSLSREEFAAGIKKVQERFHGPKPPGFGPGFGGPGGPFGPPMMPGPVRGGMGPMGRGPMGPDPMGPGPKGPGPMMGPPRGVPGPAALVERLDKDNDGKLTKDEVPAPVWERMSRADANNDGAVTKDELEAARKKMQERFELMRKLPPPKEKPAPKF